MTIEYRTKNGIEYAMLSKSLRKDGKVIKSPRTNLGRVINKSEGIYKNRTRGIFKYDPETDKYSKVPPDFEEPVFKRKKKYRDRKILEIEFGSPFFSMLSCSN